MHIVTDKEKYKLLVFKGFFNLFEDTEEAMKCLAESLVDIAEHLDDIRANEKQNSKMLRGI